MPNDSGGSDDPPAPGASQAITVNSSLRAVELPSPGRPAVTDVAVEEDQRRPVAGPFVGDPEAVDLDRLHVDQVLPGRVVWRAR